jgi:endonuclease III
MDIKSQIKEFINISESIRIDDRKNFQFFKNIDESKENIEKANNLLFDLEKTPHVFVLGCIMDLGINFELAWILPYKVFSAFEKLKYINNYSINELSKIDLEKYKYVFNDYYSKHLHRYNYMAKRFRDAILLIKEKYNSNASLIWTKGEPSAGTVSKRFEEFNGVGQKISTMAAKILGGKLNITFSNYRDLDIPVDRQVIKVMRRLGLINYPNNENLFKKTIIDKTREWNPEYPGIFDYACFKVGVNYCKNENPNCKCCILKNICEKKI